MCTILYFHFCIHYRVLTISKFQFPFVILTSSLEKYLFKSFAHLRLSCLLTFYLFFKIYSLIGGKLLYNVVLVSAIQPHNSAIIIHISPPSLLSFNSSLYTSPLLYVGLHIFSLKKMKSMLSFHFLEAIVIEQTLTSSHMIKSTDCRKDEI